MTFYWHAFNDLSGTRAIGIGLGPIPWTAIDAWARRHRVTDSDDFDLLAAVIAALDAEHLTLTRPADG